MDWTGLILTGVVGLLLGMLLLIVAIMNPVIDQRNKAREDLKASAKAMAEQEEDLRLHRSSGADLAPNVFWQKTKLMGASEFRVYLALEQIVARCSQGHRLFSQVGFGGFLAVPTTARNEKVARAAFYAVGRKRADFLIIDRRGFPVAVVEYQGHDHYQGNAHHRDHAKRIACQRAGIAFIEVPADGLTDGQRRDLEALLSPPSTRIAAE